MDFLSILGSELTPDQIKSNSEFSENKNNIPAIMEADYNLLINQSNIASFMSETSIATDIVEYFALENFELGMEGFLGNLWFKFVQFIKKLLDHIAVMFTHFFTGINRKAVYLDSMKIKLQTSKEFNWMGLHSATIRAYDPESFHDILSACELMQKVLIHLFDDKEFDLDSISDFSKYGISFEKGCVKKNGLGDKYSPSEFDLGYRMQSDITLGKMGWDGAKVAKLCDELCNQLKFHKDKDYLFIKYKYAMESLVRNKEQEKSVDREYVNKITQTVKSATSILLYITRLINECSSQMVAMCKILESTPDKEPNRNVEY